jgi:hypothetical protein
MKRTTLVRIRIKTLKKIRESTPRFTSDSDRFDALYKMSPFHLDSWLGKPVKKKRRR